MHQKWAVIAHASECARVYCNVCVAHTHTRLWKALYLFSLQTMYTRTQIHTNWSELFSWLLLLFCWFVFARGGVDDEHALMLGGVDVGEFPEQPIPLTVCWYIIESPAMESTRKRKTIKSNINFFFNEIKTKTKKRKFSILYRQLEIIIAK